MKSEMVMTIILAVFASTGFWAFITMLVQRRDKHTSARDKILLGIAHNVIRTLGEDYISKGSITTSDYKDLYDYLYKPYKDLGGNGTAEKIMNEVNKLPLKED